MDGSEHWLVTKEDISQGGSSLVLQIFITVQHIVVECQIKAIYDARARQGKFGSLRERS